jgi:hypothetical protein
VPTGRSRFQGKLDALGKADWVIESRPGAAQASCVSSFVFVGMPTPEADGAAILELWGSLAVI